MTRKSKRCTENFMCLGKGCAGGNVVAVSVDEEPSPYQFMLGDT